MSEMNRFFNWSAYNSLTIDIILVQDFQKGYFIFSFFCSLPIINIRFRFECQQLRKFNDFLIDITGFRRIEIQSSWSGSGRLSGTGDVPAYLKGFGIFLSSHLLVLGHSGGIIFPIDSIQTMNGIKIKGAPCGTRCLNIWFVWLIHPLSVNLYKD